MSEKQLYVIGVISNPVRYKSRYRLYNQFAEHMRAAGVTLITVEQAFGERPFMVTDANNPHHVQVRAGSESELWIKESMVNIGYRHLIQRFPRCQYVAWIDADVEFVRPDWVEETIDQLQHYRVIQPWSDCIDLGPNRETIATHKSFGYGYLNPPANKHEEKYNSPFRHPGYAWAIRRDVLDKMGGQLIDWCVLGAGDHHMAWAFVGNIDKAIPLGITNAAYRRKAGEFQALCDQFIQKELGYATGTILHHWHGSKKKRYYIERWQTLIGNGFDPDKDITYNGDGLLVWTGNNMPLQQDTRRYFRSREEDSIDLA